MPEYKLNKCLLFVLAFLQATIAALAQDAYEQKYTIKGNVDFIRTDKLGNLYTVKNDMIQKYDATGKSTMRFSNKALGQIHYFDSSNPLKLLLFYPEFNTLLFLDNQLSENGSPVKLENYELDQAILACTSFDNGIWIFDQREFELVRLDQGLQRTHKTGNIPQLTGLKVNPMALYEANNRVFLVDSLAGILTFDIFGTYSKLIPLKGISELAFLDDELIYFNEGKLNFFNLKTLDIRQQFLPMAGARQVLIDKKNLYLCLPDRVICYKINTP
jgi:hypothetical protein